MSKAVSSVINRHSPEQKDKIGAYRAINNDRYTYDDLIDCLQKDCAAHVSGGEHVLCIEGTSEFDYHHISKRLEDGDPDVSKGSTDLLMHSFFLHPTLVVNADAFDIMRGIKACGCDFLIRLRHNRQDLSNGKRLHDSLHSAPLFATFSLKMPGNGKHFPHEAKMELRFKDVEIASTNGETLSAWCVLASESAQSVPHGEQPIVWYLLTSHPTDTVEQATECVRRYRMRWSIEELFRTLKSNGFNMESVQLETGKAIKKLLILTMQASLMVMRMKQTLDDCREDIEASAILGSEYIKVLDVYAHKYRGEKRRNQGNTNPYRKGSLPWAAWITARIGGWSGYEKAHGKPGRITLCEGFQKLTAMVDFNLEKEKYEDVYKD